MTLEAIRSAWIAGVVSTAGSSLVPRVVRITRTSASLCVRTPTRSRHALIPMVCVQSRALWRSPLAVARRRTIQPSSPWRWRLDTRTMARERLRSRQFRRSAELVRTFSTSALRCSHSEAGAEGFVEPLQSGTSRSRRTSLGTRYPSTGSAMVGRTVTFSADVVERSMQLQSSRRSFVGSCLASTGWVRAR